MTDINCLDANYFLDFTRLFCDISPFSFLYLTRVHYRANTTMWQDELMSGNSAKAYDARMTGLLNRNFTPEGCIEFYSHCASYYEQV